MKKQYTKKQIQEAISYWKKQLNEGLFDGGSPVKKFMKELQAAVQKPQSVLIGASKKNGKTCTVSDFEYKEGSLTFFADDTKLYGDKQLAANEFIEKLTAEGVKAKQVDGLYVRFPDGVYDVSDVTVMETTSKVYGRGVIIILGVSVGGTNSAAINSFFN